MKRMLRIFLALLLILPVFSGCSPTAQEPAAPTSIIIDQSFCLVYDDADENIRQAAASLRTAMGEKLDMDIKTSEGTTPEQGKMITLQVNSKDLQPGQYQTRLHHTGAIIEGYDSLTLLQGTRSIREYWLTDTGGLIDDGKLLLNERLCRKLSGSIDANNPSHFVMTQNVRCFDDPEGSMNTRAKRLEKLVREYQPDIICTQESYRNFVYAYDTVFSDTYERIGYYNLGPSATDGVQTCILYRKDRYELIEWKTFWLCDTPNTPGSKYPNSNSIRTCTWVLLKDKATEEEIFVANLHLDNSTTTVQKNQLNVAMTQLRSYMEQYPFILAGDFNATPGSTIYTTVTGKLQDSSVTANLSQGTYTYDGYGQKSKKLYDYLLHNTGFAAEEYRILYDQYGGYVSDHYAILTEFKTN